MKNATIFLICLTLFLPTAPAGAYVLKSGHILQLMAASLGKTKHFKISQNLVVHDPVSENSKIVLPETVHYSLPSKFRSDIKAEASQRIHIATSQATLTVIGSRIVPETGSLFDSYKDLLLLRSRPRLEQWLDNVGIDIGISSLGRFNDTLALIIGAQYPDESVSQVWVDKTTFRPLRWIIKTEEPLIREFEIRYLQWQAIGQDWYPWKIEFYENQMLVRQILVGQVSPEKTIARKMFDIAALKQQYAAAMSSQAPGGEDTRVNEVQDTIDSFKKRFE
ncbi:MAG: hypothetical protein GY697_02960 [Desulfobacterales bacterium]|nr:hypothetical protein [Desulfobacterales bacterium]